MSIQILYLSSFGSFCISENLSFASKLYNLLINKRCSNNTLIQRSPNFLAPDTGFLEDNLSTDGGGGGDGNASDGERQMKLRSLACHSIPAVWPGS